MPKVDDIPIYMKTPAGFVLVRNNAQPGFPDSYVQISQGAAVSAPTPLPSGGQQGAVLAVTPTTAVIPSIQKTPAAVSPTPLMVGRIPSGGVGSGQPVAASHASLSRTTTAPVTTRASKRKASEAQPQPPKRRQYALTQDVSSRISRALSQRMFLVQREKRNETCEAFSVLGSTGNLFVKLKVLRINQTSELVWARKHLDHELIHIFSNAVPDPTAVASKRVQDAFAVVTGQCTPSESAKDPESGEARLPGHVPRRKPTANDSCPICYEDFTGEEDASSKAANRLVYCAKGCGNPLHFECIDEWKKNCMKKGLPFTCVYCRADWVEEGSGTGSRTKAKGKRRAVAAVNEGYLNLGSVAGLPEERDDSSYGFSGFRGRRRRSFGYNHDKD
ncbi:hypothetical protein HDU67_003637 [Dinochytrium kinnereticum]|nr:hypothetical protein HDU67_003637 [Dinochytrium kinnereticum]